MRTRRYVDTGRARLLGRLAGSIAPAAVDSIASAIENQEGYYPGSLAFSNNNPGNLRYAGQVGATAGAGGFAKFRTPADGRAALKAQIALDASRGTDVNGNPTNTLAELISSWAPASENNTAAYIASVSAATGYDPDAPLSSLGSGMIFSSGGFDVSSFPTVDLSAVGLPDNTSALYAGIGGLVALSLLTRLF